MVEYTDPQGKIQTQQYARFNSGGATEFSGRSLGDTFDFQLQFESSVPNSVRLFQWRNLGLVCLLMGGMIATIGLLLRIGPSL